MKFCSDCKNKYLITGSPCSECRHFDKMESGNPAVVLLEKIIAEIEDKRGKDCPEPIRQIASGECLWLMKWRY